MTDELPDIENEPPTLSDALDWSVLFERHYREAFRINCFELTTDSTSENFQAAAAQAFISTLRDSGIEESSLIKIVGEAIWGPTKVDEQWTEMKNIRRTDLIDKMFLDALTFEEQFELNSLTRIMRAALDTEANIPTAGVKKLYLELRKREEDK